MPLAKLIGLVFCVLVPAILVAAAQPSTLNSSEARSFMGTWVIAMEVPKGTQETVRIWDQDGKVAASVQAGSFPSIQVPNVRKDGDALVLTAQRWENGQPIQAIVRLILAGEIMKLTQDLEGSPVQKYGTGKKRAETSDR